MFLEYFVFQTFQKKGIPTYTNHFSKVFHIQCVFSVSRTSVSGGYGDHRLRSGERTERGAHRQGRRPGRDVATGIKKKTNPWGSPDFSLFFLLPIGFFRYPFLTHCHVEFLEKVNLREPM